MKKQTVLIVDDESINISVLVKILDEKYNLLVATDGLIALDVINSSESIDLILLDIMMPNMSGFEVAYKIKHNKKTAEIPFIFLSAKNDSKSIVDGFKAGAVDYISKPFAKEELLARVHTHLQLYKFKNALTDALSELQSNVDKLNSTNVLLDSVINSTNDLIFYKDKNFKYLGCNEAFLKFVGKSKEMVVGFDDFEIFDNEIATLFRDIDLKVLRDNMIETNEELVTYPDEHKAYLQTKKIPFNYSDEDIGILGLSRDITDEKIAQDKINNYVKLVDENILTSMTNLDGEITDVSEAFCKISGYTKEELIGQKHKVIKHPDNDPEVYEELWNTITQDKVWKGVIKNRAKDGSAYWVDAAIYPTYDHYGNKTGYTGIRQDITDKKRVEELSITDELTTLYNRRHFNEVFENELNRAKRENSNISFLMLDVDHFKAYNDTYGHQEGDVVLAKIGKVLKKFSKRANDFAFRLGGEEFGVIFYERNMTDAINFANTLKDAIESLNIPHSKNSASDVVTASIGLMYKDKLDNVNVQDLYRYADESLYNAKATGRNKVITN